MKHTINCKGELIDLSSPKVMGILNVTPDSFYDGGRYTTERDILIKVERMLKEGAAFIDVGAYSTRPNARNISPEQEIYRSLKAITAISKTFPKALICADTFRSNVAQEAVKAGACMINDISGGTVDDNMFQTVATLQVPYVLMHIQGTPQTMQDKPHYTDIVYDIRAYFSEKIVQLRHLGVNDIILDVGFGFGKTIKHNYQLLQNLDLFNCFDVPLMVGISRKSMLYKVLESNADKALNATTVANTLALQRGVKILRVHDVKEAIETIQIVNQLAV